MKLSRCFVVVIAAWGVHVFSCATTASVTVTKPPMWNTGAMSRIAISPFASENSPMESQVAQFFTAKATQNILDTGKFTLIDYSEIAKLEKAGENIADHVDAIFSGRINRIASRNRSETYEDKEGKTHYTYYREVDLELSYMLKRAGDGAIIGQALREESSTASGAEQDKLPAVYDMATAIAASEAANLKRYLAPWQTVERRVFEDDKMKDPRMKQAKLMLKERSFRSALAVYTTIYQDSLNFAAGFNAALCAEILGDVEGAAARMRQVWDDSSNPKASTELARLQTVIADAAKVRQGYGGETDSVVNSAVKQASRELLDKIPAGSRVSFVGGRGSSQTTLDFILEELSAAVVNTGAIMVVDRQQIDAIVAEQRFQLSGEVSDETAVSIGRLSGSQIIVSCSITGAGSQRRLRARAIAVETGVILCQISLQL